MYDPIVGRFLQEDPLEYDTDINLYRYVGNGPTNFTDPSGMQARPAQHAPVELEQLAAAYRTTFGRGAQVLPTGKILVSTGPQFGGGIHEERTPDEIRQLLASVGKSPPTTPPASQNFSGGFSYGKLTSPGGSGPYSYPSSDGYTPPAPQTPAGYGSLTKPGGYGTWGGDTIQIGRDTEAARLAPVGGDPWARQSKRERVLSWVREFDGIMHAYITEGKIRLDTDYDGAFWAEHGYKGIRRERGQRTLLVDRDYSDEAQATHIALLLLNDKEFQDFAASRRPATPGMSAPHPRTQADEVRRAMARLAAARPGTAGYQYAQNAEVAAFFGVSEHRTGAQIAFDCSYLFVGPVDEDGGVVWKGISYWAFGPRSQPTIRDARPHINGAPVEPIGRVGEPLPSLRETPAPLWLPPRPGRPSLAGTAPVLPAQPRDQRLPDPHNNKPSLQRELWMRDYPLPRYLEPAVKDVRAAGPYNTKARSADDARRLLLEAMPDAVELPPAVAGMKEYPKAPKGVKNWFQLQPPEPWVGNHLPHFKYENWTNGKKFEGGSWGHIEFPE